MEGSETMSYSDILDKAMHNRQSVAVQTTKRGLIAGIPHAVDEFETDDNRFGYFIETGDHELDTVFLDEIVDIVIQQAVPA